MRVLYATFADRAVADAAMDELQAAVPQARVMVHGGGENEAEDAVESRLHQGVLRGIGFGAVGGALLVGPGFYWLGLVGDAVGSAALVGAFLGVLYGGMAGALAGAGSPDERFEGAGGQRGTVLVSIELAGPAAAELAESVLVGRGARVARKAYLSSGR